MRAFRTKLRSWRSFGGWLALFVLGLQLMLSFGHIHAEDFARAGAATTQSQSAPPNVPQNTPDGDHHDGDRDGCAICAVMHLAATSLVPVPPSLGLPPAATFIAQFILKRAALPPVSRQPFHARAPPQA